MARAPFTEGDVRRAVAPLLKLGLQVVRVECEAGRVVAFVGEGGATAPAAAETLTPLQAWEARRASRDEG